MTPGLSGIEGRRLGAVCAVFLLLGAGAAVGQPPPVPPAQATTPYDRALIHAQVGLFTGDYAMAYAQLNAAKDEAQRIPRQQNDPDARMRAEVVCDTLRAECHSGQGYFDEANTRYQTAEKLLTKRAVFWAQHGWNVQQLAVYNFRLGYVFLCMGDTKLAKARVDAIVQDRPLGASGKVAIDWYNKGVGFIQGVVNAGGNFVDPALAKALLARCDLRLARAKAMNGLDIEAQGHFRQAEGFLKQDHRWIKQFDPNGPQAKALQGQQSAAQAPAAPPTAQAVPNDEEAMDLARTALAYIDLLNVACELHLDATPPRPQQAEESASLARDIAEERFPATAVYWESLVNLARAYCAGYKQELQRGVDNPDAVVQVDGQAVNIHRKAAETYIRDVEDLVRQAKEASKNLNPRRPIRFHILDVERTLAKDRKDGEALLRLKAECERLAADRASDKVPPDPR